MTDSDTTLPGKTPSPDPLPPEPDAMVSEEHPANLSTPQKDTPDHRRNEAQMQAQSRRRTVLFVVGFLIIAGGLITAYRYSTETLANHLYLYSVACNTVGVLGLVGDEVQFENGDQFTGHERQVRAHLSEWAEGKLEMLPPLGPPEKGDTPLSSWEVYRYRMIELYSDLERERYYLDQLRWVPAAVESPEEHLALLKERFALLEGIVYRGNTPPVAPVAPREVIELLPRIRQVLDQLVSGAVPSGQFLDTAMAVQTDLEWMVTEAQRTFLTNRVIDQTTRVVESGPYIHFIAKPSYAARIALLEKEVQENGEGADRARMEIDRLRSELEQRQTDSQKPGAVPFVDRGKSFPFIIVPDCGAIPSMSIFIAAVLAFPCIWWRRLLGILLGVPILYYVNIGRLSCLALIGAYDDTGKVFRFVHEYVWQGIYVIFVVVVWLIWVEVLVKKRPTPSV